MDDTQTTKPDLLRGPADWRPMSELLPDTAVLVYGFGYEVAHYNTLHKALVSCRDHRPVQGEWWMPLPQEPLKPPHGEE